MFQRLQIVVNVNHRYVNTLCKRNFTLLLNDSSNYDINDPIKCLTSINRNEQEIVREGYKIKNIMLV